MASFVNTELLLTLLAKRSGLLCLSVVCPTWHTWAVVGERGRFAVGVFPEGLVLSWDCPNLFVLNVFWRVFVSNFTDTHISLVHNKEIWGDM